MKPTSANRRSFLDRVRKAVVIAGVLWVLFGGWLLLVERWHDGVRPRGPMLADQLPEIPDPVRAETFTFRGREYLMVEGAYQMLPRVPSGPPVYVYDATGRLADWTADEGDDEAFQSRWFGTTDRRPLTRDEASAWPGARP